MNIKIDLNDIIIKNVKSGEERKVRTLRSVDDIANDVEQSEKELQIEYVHELVLEAYD